MLQFFLFSAIAQFVAGALAVATAAHWTRSTLALSLVAFGSGFCPPLQEWFYGVHLTSSEIVALPELALMFFVLSKALVGWSTMGAMPTALSGHVNSTPKHAHAKPWAWHPENKFLESSNKTLMGLWQRLWPRGLSREVWLLFALTGVLIGCASLSRDCIRAFAWFLAVFLVMRTVAVDRRRLRAAITVAVVLLAGEYATRYPVQVWNRHRSGRSTVCQSSDGCIWRYGIWAKHNEYAWYETAGIGFGDYLDPEASQRVRDHFAEKLPFETWYSFTQLVQAVLHRPVDAVMFKVVRLPVLWLATDLWPRSVVRPQSVWCAAMYTLLAVFVVVQIRRKRAIPEVLYLYLVLIACTSPVMHFEFRYTFPIWNTLVLVPGLLAASLSRDGWQPQCRDHRDSCRTYRIGKHCIRPVFMPRAIGRIIAMERCHE